MDKGNRFGGIAASPQCQARATPRPCLRCGLAGFSDELTCVRPDRICYIASGLRKIFGQSGKEAANDPQGNGGRHRLAGGGPLASAQTAPGRLHWQAGQVLTYRVEQTTLHSDVVGDSKVETKTKLNLIKRWQVVSVDAAGAATLQLSLATLRLETTTPGGDTLLFDSANPDKNTPELQTQLSGYVGKALALLRVDDQGRVLEVKESKFGPASRYRE